MAQLIQIAVKRMVYMYRISRGMGVMGGGVFVGGGVCVWGVCVCLCVWGVGIYVYVGGVVGVC